MTILVFDVGSSALKAVVFGADGAILGSAEASYPPSTTPNRQSADAWWQAAREAASRLPLADVEALALTGTMENLFAVDGAGAPVADAILYPDACGAPVLEALGAEQRAAMATIAGNAPEPLMSVFKLCSMRKAEPEAFGVAQKFLPGAKDFLALKLTERAVTDPTCASTTGLMDLRHRDWSQSLLEGFGIDRATLPDIAAACMIVGPLLPRPALELGLPAGIPLINGSGDAGATTLGSGADKPGDFSLYLGTSGWVARVVPSPAETRPVPFYRLAHPLNGGLIEIAPILSAGAASNWARQALGLDLKTAETLAAESDRAPKDIVFFPYLSGERSPFLDLDLRAAFLGLGADATPGDLYRAVLEGVAFSIAANLDTMGRSDTGVVGLAGGGAQSALWPQLIADVIGAAVTVAPHPVEATAFGAFRIATEALGRQLDRGAGGVRIPPRPERAARALRLKQKFMDFSQALRDFSR